MRKVLDKRGAGRTLALSGKIPTPQNKKLEKAVAKSATTCIL